MIDEKKIEEAASAYGTSNGYSVIGPDGRISLKPELETAFEAGVHWAINEFLDNLWHSVSEKPNKARVFLYKTIFKGYGLNKIIDGNEWKYIIKYQKATQWCYIDDLFPKGGGNYD